MKNRSHGAPIATEQQSVRCRYASSAQPFGCMPWKGCRPPGARSYSGQCSRSRNHQKEMIHGETTEGNKRLTTISSAAKGGGKSSFFPPFAPRISLSAFLCFFMIIPQSLKRGRKTFPSGRLSSSNIDSPYIQTEFSLDGLTTSFSLPPRTDLFVMFLFFVLPIDLSGALRAGAPPPSISPCLCD